MPPSVFVPLLERSGAIVDVGEWVILQAVRDIGDWLKAGHAGHSRGGQRLAIAIAAARLRGASSVSHRARRVKFPGGVDIEITESMLMQDLELSIRKLAQLREAGIGVAIDDFGTGYSSLRLLARLPVDTLKIDRSFVQDITAGPSAMTLVSTVVSLARAFGMSTVAEGVETAEQLEMLRQSGCELAQGFLFARPHPAADVPAVIRHLSHHAGDGRAGGGAAELNERTRFGA